MELLDAWIDDYLRAITHTRPWTKRREERALEQFADWARLQYQSVEATLLLDESGLAARCGADLKLGVEAREQLRAAVSHLAHWARAEAE